MPRLNITPAYLSQVATDGIIVGHLIYFDFETSDIYSTDL
jgi:hypothetical protein